MRRTAPSLIVPLIAALGAGAIVGAGNLIASAVTSYPATLNLYGAKRGIGWSTQWRDVGALPTGAALFDLTWPNLPTSGRSATTATWTATATPTAPT